MPTRKQRRHQAKAKRQLNRSPQYAAGMAEPFGHLLLVSRWMPQHFGRKEKALHVVK